MEAERYYLQRTLRRSVKFEGIGLHSGTTVHVEIQPAPANTGIKFIRTDLPNTPVLEAKATNVYDTSLATRLGVPPATVNTVEHLLAAFFALGIDNAIVRIDNFEVPILDGSALPFLVLLDEAGIQPLKAYKRLLKIKEPVEIVAPNTPDRFIRIEPSSTPQISYVIDFPKAPAIGKQVLHVEYNGATLCKDLCYARTFCLASDIEAMFARGLAKGGSLKNAIVVDPKTGVQNTHGLRAADEFVRHKILDCMGDLALVGMPIIGHVIAHKAGHDLHTKLAAHLLTHLHAHEVIVPSQELFAKKKLGTLLIFPESLAEFSSALRLSAIQG